MEMSGGLPPLSQALETFAQCSKLFIAARAQGRIRFDSDLVTFGTELVSTMLARALQNPLKLPRYFNHVSRHGVEACMELIAEVERRPDKRLRAADLTTLASLEKDGPEV